MSQPKIRENRKCIVQTLISLYIKCLISASVIALATLYWKIGKSNHLNKLPLVYLSIGKFTMGPLCLDTSHCKAVYIWNRPGVAGAVLWTPLSLFHSLFNSLSRWSFCSESSRHCLFQIVRARELKGWENIHPPPWVPCHMSHVMCQVSHVRCQVSLFYLNFYSSFLFHFVKLVELVGGVSVINGAYSVKFLTN